MEELVFIDTAHLPVKITEVFIKHAQTVFPNKTKILAYSYEIEGQLHFANFYLNKLAKIHNILCKKNQIINKLNTPIVSLQSDCLHPVSPSDIDKVMLKSDMINMAHDSLGLTVSQDEAKRMDSETGTRLRSEKRLALLLDLDQTIIQATVDPTVGEWLADQMNPNYPLLEDVYSFVLTGHPHVYYIKLRPGAIDFLTSISKKYEMHIYTMGSRQYAEAVSKVIDPKREVFKERILSRDENGSDSIKSIKRLFPFDSSMVVVVDDRGDIWSWPDNLFKVRPYEFFVGIGDINAPVSAAMQVASKVKQNKIHLGESDPTLLPSLPASNQQAVIMAEVLSLSEGNEKLIMEELDHVESTSLDKEAKDRPLMHEMSKQSIVTRKRPVLNDDDFQLEVVSRILDEVHGEYYGLIIENCAGKGGYGQTDEPDAGMIMREKKGRILEGCWVLFSGLFSQTHDPRKHDCWKLANSLGANCMVELSDSVTHVIAAKRGTAKVNAAKNMPGVALVGIEWLNECAYKWERVPETPYLLEPICQTASSSKRKHHNPTTNPPPPHHQIDTKINEDFGLNKEDEEILSGDWEHKDDIYIKFGHEDWERMNKEIEDAMEDDDEEDEVSGGGEEDENDWDLDAILDESLETAENSEVGVGSKRKEEEEDGEEKGSPIGTRKRLKRDFED